MVTAVQKKTAQAIVNVFETGEVLGDYGRVTLLEGDSGHLTFGRSQTTLSSGNLHALLKRYCETEGARFGQRLLGYLDRLAARDVALDADIRLHNLLMATADDPVMRATQDAFFDDVYWDTAVAACARIGIGTPLGVAVVYDSTIHGSFEPIRERTVQKTGDVVAARERAWIAAYIQTRRDWLSKHSNSVLRATVYRVDALQGLVNAGCWELDLPLMVRGREISSRTLSELPPGCYDGPQLGSRSLTVQTPLQRGLDVRLVQLALSDLGARIKADGVFGPLSSRCVSEYQSRRAVAPNGVADPTLIAGLVS